MRCLNGMRSGGSLRNETPSMVRISHVRSDLLWGMDDVLVHSGGVEDGKGVEGGS